MIITNYKDILNRKSVALASLSLLTLVVCATLFFLPLGKDEGAFTTIGWIISKGGIPYIDAFDHKPPGIYLISYISTSIYDSVYSVRILTVTITLLGGLFVYKSISEEEGYSSIVSFFVYVWACLIYTSGRLSTELGVALFIAISIFILKCYSEKSHKYFVLGLSMGMAGIFKQPAAFSALALGMYIAMNHRNNFKLLAGRTSLYLIGTIMPFITLGIIYAIMGGFNDLIDGVIGANIKYGKRTGLLGTLNALYENIFTIPIVWLLSMLGLVYYIKIENRSKVLSAAVYILIFSLIVPFVRTYPHYLIQLVPSLSILSAYGYTFISEEFRLYKSTYNQVATATIVIFLMLPTLHFVAFKANKISEFNIVKDTRIGNKIDRLTRGRLFIYAAKPQYYYLSRRLPIDRNIFYLPAGQNVTYTSESIIRRLKNRNSKFSIIRQSCIERLQPSCSAVMSFAKKNYTKVGKFENQNSTMIIFKDNR